MVQRHLATSFAFNILGNDWACWCLVLIVLEIVHFDLADVSTSHGVTICLASSDRSSHCMVSLLHILLAWIRYQVSHSQHLCLVDTLA